MPPTRFIGTDIRISPILCGNSSGIIQWISVRQENALMTMSEIYNTFMAEDSIILEIRIRMPEGGQNDIFKFVMRRKRRRKEVYYGQDIKCKRMRNGLQHMLLLRKYVHRL